MFLATRPGHRSDQLDGVKRASRFNGRAKVRETFNQRFGQLELEVRTIFDK